MAVIGEAFVRVRPETAGFSSQTESGVLSGLKGIALKGAAILGGIFAVKQGAEFVSGLIAAGEGLTKQQRLVDAAIQSTGNAAHVSSAGLKAYAEAQGAVTGQTAEGITQLQQVLLRFTGVRNEVGAGNDIFTRAQGTIQNVSAALGKGLQPVAIAVGKALQDPVHGMTTLAKFTGNLSQSQKDLVKNLVASGDTIGAQKVILDTLAQRYGNAASAAATFTEKLHAEVSNVKDALGQSLEPAVGALVSGLLPVIPEVGKILTEAVQTVLPAIEPVLTQLGPLFEHAIQGVAPAFVGLVKTLSGVIGGIAPIIGDLAGVVKAVAPAFQPIATAIGIVARAFGAIATPAIQGFANILSRFVSAIIPPLNAALKALAPEIQLAARIFGDTFGAALDTVAPIIGSLAKVLGGALVTALRAIRPLITPLATLFADLAGSVIDLGGNVLKALVPAFKAWLDAITPVIPPLVQIAQSLITRLALVFEQLEPQLVSVAQTLGGVFTQAIQALAPVLPNLATALGQIGELLIGVLQAGLSAVVPVLPVIVGAFRDLVTAIVPLVGPIADVASILAGALADALVAIGPSLRDLVTALGQGLVTVIRALAPELPALAAAFVKIAVALADILVQVTPLIPPLLELATTLIDAIGVPTLTAIAVALARVAEAVALLVGHTEILAPLLAALGTLWAVNQIEQFANAIGTAGEAVVTFIAQLSASSVTSFIVNLVQGKQALTDLSLGFKATREAAAAFTAEEIAAGEASTFALGPVGIIAAVVVALGIAFFEAYQNIKPFRDAVNKTAHDVAVAAIAIKDAFVGTLGWIRDNLPLVGELIVATLVPPVGVPILVATHLHEIVAEFQKLPGQVVAALEALPNVISTVLSDALGVVRDRWGRVIVTLIVGPFVAIPALVAGELAGLVSAINDSLTNLGTTLADAFKRAVDFVVTELPGLFVNALVFFTTRLPGLLAQGLAFLSGFLLGEFTRAIVTLGAALPGLFSSALSGIRSAVGAALDGLGTVLTTAFRAAVSFLINDLPGMFLDLVKFTNVQLPAMLAEGFAWLTGFLVGTFVRAVAELATSLPRAFVAVSDFFGSLRARVVSALGDAGSFLVGVGGEMLSGLLQGLQIAGEEVRNFFVALPGAILGAATTAGSAIHDALVSSIQAAIDFFKGLPGQLSGAGGSIGSAVHDALSTAAQGAIGGLIVGFTEGLPAALDFLKGVPGQIRDALPAAGTWLLQVGKDVLGGLLAGIEAGLVGIGHFFQTIVQKFIDGFKQGFGIGSPATTMIPIGVAILQGILQGALNAVGLLLSFAASLPGRVLGVLANVGAIFTSVGSSIINGIVTGAQALVGTLLGLFGGLPGRIVGVFLGGIGVFVGAGRNVVQGILNGITSSMGSLFAWAAGLGSALLGRVGSVASQFVQIGKGIIDGIKQGIANGVGDLWGALKDGLSSLFGDAMSFLGISSPSRKAERELGKPIPEGVAQGIRAGVPAARQAILDLANTMTAQARTAFTNLFDPAATAKQLDASLNQFGAEINSNDAIGKAFQKQAKDAADEFNKVLAGKRADINTTLRGLGLDTLPKDFQTNLESINKFFLGAGQINLGPAQLQPLIDFGKNFDLKDATATSTSMGNALEFVAFEAKNIGLQAGPGLNDFREKVLATGGATTGVVERITTDLGGIEGLLGHALDPTQVGAFTNAIGNLSNATPGTEQFTNAVAGINTQAVALGVSAPNLQHFQQLALDMGGAPVTNVDALRAAIASLAVVTSGSIANANAALDSAFLSFGQAGVNFGHTFTDLTSFTLNLHGASLQAYQSLLQVASATTQAAQASVQQTGDTKQAVAIISQQSDGMLKLAENAGLPTTAAAKLTAQLLGIPPETISNVSTNAGAMTQIVFNYLTQIQHIPPDKATKVIASIFGAGAVKDLDHDLRNLPSPKVIITADTSSVQQAIAAFNNPFGSLALHLHGTARNSPLKEYDDFGDMARAVVAGFQHNLDGAPTPSLALLMDTADIKGASLHPLPNAGTIVTKVIQSSVKPVSIPLQIDVKLPATDAIAKAAFQLTGTLDSLISSATGSLPTVSSAISEFSQRFQDALKAANKASIDFRNAQIKLFVDVAHGADLATQLTDTDAANKAGAAGVKAMVALNNAMDPKNFIAVLQQRNDSITNIQNDLARLLALGDTALAAEIAKEGPSANRLANFLANNSKAAKQAEDLLRKGQSLQTQFEGFLNTSFGPDFAAQAGAAGSSAGQSLAQQMSEGLLGVLPAARAIVGQLRAVLGPDLATPLTNAVNTAATQAASAVQNLNVQATAPAVVAPVAPVAPTGSTTSIVVDLTVELPEGGTAKATIPFTVRTSPTSLTQRVQATARAQ